MNYKDSDNRDIDDQDPTILVQTQSVGPVTRGGCPRIRGGQEQQVEQTSKGATTTPKK